MLRKLGAAAAVTAALSLSLSLPVSAAGTGGGRGLGVTSTLRSYDPGAWTYWGGDAGQTRYAPLDQINRKTVNRLKVAWRWSADTSGSPSSNNYKSTPLLVDGVLYMPWVNNGMAAIDAGTGKTLWTYEPQPVDMGAGGASLAPRSLAYWTDGRERRVIHNSLDGRLISVDARTGKADPAFGGRGWIDLRKGLTEGRAVTDVRSVSPAIVVGDVIVAQVIPGGARNKEATPGNFRGFDVRTGKLLWTFNVVPQPGEFGNETWENGSWAWAGNSGAWTMMSADPETGYVYFATDTPSNDFGGVERPGDNLFAESLLVLDSKTRKRVWHFQTVHHGIWDYDNPAAPILHDIVRNGRRIKAVTQLTKQGFIFTFDRITGKPIWPIEERPVPQGGVPGEKLSPTQPFPTWPLPLLAQGYSEDRLIDFTPELRAQAVELMKQYNKGPIYTPLVEVKPGLRGTLINPGYGGGPNWNGASVDPTTNIMYVPIRHKPNAAGLAKGDPARTNMAYVQSGNHVVMGPQGLPLFKPPWSEVVAVDMDTGRHLWRIPLGTASEQIRKHKALQGLKLDFDSMGMFDVRPSPVLTKELFFLGESGNLTGGTGTNKFRAYDKRNGKVLFETALPAYVTGAPMTYMHKGRQYVVVAVSGTGKPAELVALTLDGMSDNGAPPPGGIQLAAAPPASTQAAARIEATPQELALGKAQYDGKCALCHGANGGEGPAPSLRGRTDLANITRVVAQGQGEMPALGSAMSAGEIQAVAKYVLKTWPPAQRAGRGPPPREEE
ncbi:PQQ-binding-like beta-propeller repeat protein [Phenylobacterium sp.]|jgi:quinoprotein glucose dehydrogenase|uniref:outer membrane protein assembly factor BamB family protein n=1 Tax=Phenylobacterium sp. TaxID=1871053 RepID=UPI002F92AF28